MSSLAAFANLDVDKLIIDIASRPAIWDKNFNGRQNKGFLEDNWDDLVSRSPPHQRPLLNLQIFSFSRLLRLPYTTLRVSCESFVFVCKCETCIIIIDD